MEKPERTFWPTQITPLGFGFAFTAYHVSGVIPEFTECLRHFLGIRPGAHIQKHMTLLLTKKPAFQWEREDWDHLSYYGAGHPQSSLDTVSCGFGGSVSKESPNAGDHLQGCRQGCSFDPWVGKIPWRRKWQPTPVFLPGKFHEQRILVGYSPWGCKSQTWLSDQTATTIHKLQYMSWASWVSLGVQNMTSDNWNSFWGNVHFGSPWYQPISKGLKGYE